MPLTDKERKHLATVARIMIPGGAGMFGADEIDIARAPVDRVLQLEPALETGLRRFLARCADATMIASLVDIEACAKRVPEDFRALCTVLANAYFMDHRIRAQIGCPGQEARDASEGLSDADQRLCKT
jgi:hypothetical protein